MGDCNDLVPSNPVKIDNPSESLSERVQLRRTYQGTDYPWGRVIELFGSLLYAAAIAFLLPRLFTHMERVKFERSDYAFITCSLAFIVLHIAIDWLSHTRREVSISNDTGGVLVLRFAAWIVAICFLSIGHIELFDNWACRFATGDRPYCQGTTDILLRDAFSVFFALTFVLNILIMISRFNLVSLRNVWLLLSSSLRGDIDRRFFSSGFGDISKESGLAEFFTKAIDLSDSVTEGGTLKPKVLFRVAVVAGVCSILSVHFLLSGLFATFILHSNAVQQLYIVNLLISFINSNIYLVSISYIAISLGVSWLFIKRWIYCLVPIGFYIIAYSYIATLDLVHIILVLMMGQIMFSIGVLLLDPPALNTAEES